MNLTDPTFKACVNAVLLYHRKQAEQAYISYEGVLEDSVNRLAFIKASAAREVLQDIVALCDKDDRAEIRQKLNTMFINQFEGSLFKSATLAELPRQTPGKDENTNG